MKKLIGLLASGSLCMFAACSSGDDDNTIVPQQSWQQQGGNQLTQEQCSSIAPGTVLQYNPQTGVPECVSPTSASSDQGLSNAADPFGQAGVGSSAGQGGGLIPIAASSSSVAPVVIASSSSVTTPVTTPSSSSVKAATPTSTATTTPAEDVSDGKWHLALWDGTAGDPQVPTGNKTGGYWYSYTDSGDKGKSVLAWDATDDGTSADGLVPVIKECGGLCGSFDLIAGGNPYKPYVGVGFNYSKSANEVADATSSRGVCVTYTSTIDIILEMGLGSQDSKIGYANPFVTLLASASPKTVDFSWSEFEQPTWASAAQTVTNPQQALASLKFKFAGTKDSTDGGSGSFNIMKVGAPSECN
jgi:hypothetical protein